MANGLMICNDGRVISMTHGVVWHGGPLSAPIDQLTLALAATVELADTDVVAVPSAEAGATPFVRYLAGLQGLDRTKLAVVPVGDHEWDAESLLSLADLHQLPVDVERFGPVTFSPRLVGRGADGLAVGPGAAAEAVRALPRGVAAMREALRAAVDLTRRAGGVGSWAGLGAWLAAVRSAREDLRVPWTGVDDPAALYGPVSGYALGTYVARYGLPAGVDVDRLTRSLAPVSPGDLAALFGGADRPGPVRATLEGVPGAAALVRFKPAGPSAGEWQSLWLLSDEHGVVRPVAPQFDGLGVEPWADWLDDILADRRTTRVTYVDPAGRITTGAALRGEGPAWAAEREPAGPLRDALHQLSTWDGAAADCVVRITDALSFLGVPHSRVTDDGAGLRDVDRLAARLHARFGPVGDAGALRHLAPGAVTAVWLDRPGTDRHVVLVERAADGSLSVIETQPRDTGIPAGLLRGPVRLLTAADGGLAQVDVATRTVRSAGSSTGSRTVEALLDPPLRLLPGSNQALALPDLAPQHQVVAPPTVIPPAPQPASAAPATRRGFGRKLVHRPVSHRFDTANTSRWSGRLVGAALSDFDRARLTEMQALITALDTATPAARPAVVERVVAGLRALGALRDLAGGAVRAEILLKNLRGVRGATLTTLQTLAWNRRTEVDDEKVYAAIDDAARSFIIQSGGVVSAADLHAAGTVRQLRLGALRQGRTKLTEADLQRLDIELVAPAAWTRGDRSVVRQGNRLRVRADASNGAVTAELAHALASWATTFVSPQTTAADAEAIGLMAEHEAIRRLHFQGWKIGWNRFSRWTKAKTTWLKFASQVTRGALGRVERRIADLQSDPVRSAQLTAAVHTSLHETLGRKEGVRVVTTGSDKAPTTMHLFRRAFAGVGSIALTLGAGVEAGRAPALMANSVATSLTFNGVQAVTDGVAATIAAAGSPPRTVLAERQAPTTAGRYRAPRGTPPTDQLVKRAPAAVASALVSFAVSAGLTHNVGVGGVSLSIAAGQSIILGAGADYVFDRPEGIAKGRFDHYYKASPDHLRNGFVETMYYFARELHERTRQTGHRFSAGERTAVQNALGHLQRMRAALHTEAAFKVRELHRRRALLTRAGETLGIRTPAGGQTYDLVQRGVSAGAPRMWHNATRVSVQHTALQLPSWALGFWLQNVPFLQDTMMIGAALRGLGYGAGWSPAKGIEFADSVAVQAYDALVRVDHLVALFTAVLAPPAAAPAPAAVVPADPELPDAARHPIVNVFSSTTALARSQRTINAANHRPVEMPWTHQLMYKHLPAFVGQSIGYAIAGGLGWLATGPLLPTVLGVGAFVQIATAAGETVMRVNEPLYRQVARQRAAMDEVARLPWSTAEFTAAVETLAGLAEDANTRVRSVPAIRRGTWTRIGAFAADQTVWRGVRVFRRTGRVLVRVGDVVPVGRTRNLTRTPTSARSVSLTHADRRAVADLQAVLIDLETARDPRATARVDLVEADLLAELAVAFDVLGLRAEQDPTGVRWRAVAASLRFRHGRDTTVDSPTNTAVDQVRQVSLATPRRQPRLVAAIETARADSADRTQLQTAVDTLTTGPSPAPFAYFVTPAGHVEVSTGRTRSFTLDVQVSDADPAHRASLTLAPDDLVHALSMTFRSAPHTLTVHQEVFDNPAALAEALRAAGTAVALERTRAGRVGAVLRSLDTLTVHLGSFLPGVRHGGTGWVADHAPSRDLRTALHQLPRWHDDAADCVVRVTDALDHLGVPRAIVLDDGTASRDIDRLAARLNARFGPVGDRAGLAALRVGAVTPVWIDRPHRIRHVVLVERIDATTLAVIETQPQPAGVEPGLLDGPVRLAVTDSGRLAQVDIATRTVRMAPLPAGARPLPPLGVDRSTNRLFEALTDAPFRRTPGSSAQPVNLSTLNPAAQLTAPPAVLPPAPDPLPAAPAAARGFGRRFVHRSDSHRFDPANTSAWQGRWAGPGLSQFDQTRLGQLRTLVTALDTATDQNRATVTERVVEGLRSLGALRDLAGGAHRAEVLLNNLHGVRGGTLTTLRTLIWNRRTELGADHVTAAIDEAAGSFVIQSGGVVSAAGLDGSGPVPQLRVGAPSAGRTTLTDADLQRFDVDLVAPAQWTAGDRSVVRQGNRLLVRADASTAAITAELANVLAAWAAVHSQGVNAETATAAGLIAEHEAIRRLHFQGLRFGPGRLSRWLTSKGWAKHSAQVTRGALGRVERTITGLRSDAARLAQVTAPVQAALHATIGRKEGVRVVTALPDKAPTTMHLFRRGLSGIGSVALTVSAGIEAGRSPALMVNSVATSLTFNSVQAVTDGIAARGVTSGAPPRSVFPKLAAPTPAGRYAPPPLPLPYDQLIKRGPSAVTSALVSFAVSAGLTRNFGVGGVSLALSAAQSIIVGAGSDYVFDRPEGVAKGRFDHYYRATPDHQRNAFVETMYYFANEMAQRVRQNNYHLAQGELDALTQALHRVRGMQTSLTVEAAAKIRDLKRRRDLVQRAAETLGLQNRPGGTTYDIVARGVTTGAPRMWHNAARVSLQHAAMQLPSWALANWLGNAALLADTMMVGAALRGAGYGAGWSPAKGIELADSVAVQAYDAKHRADHLVQLFEGIIARAQVAAGAPAPVAPATLPALPADPQVADGSRHPIVAFFSSSTAHARAQRVINEAAGRPAEMPWTHQLAYKHVPALVGQSIGYGIAAALGWLSIGALIPTVLAVGAFVQIATAAGETVMRVNEPLYRQVARDRAARAEAARLPWTIADFATAIGLAATLAHAAHQQIQPVAVRNPGFWSRLAGFAADQTLWRGMRMVRRAGRLTLRVVDIVPVGRLRNLTRTPTTAPAVVLTRADRTALGNLEDVLVDLETVWDPRNNARVDLDLDDLTAELAVALDALGLRVEQVGSGPRWQAAQAWLGFRYGRFTGSTSRTNNLIRDLRQFPLANPGVHRPAADAITAARTADAGVQRLWDAVGALTTGPAPSPYRLDVVAENEVEVSVGIGRGFTLRVEVSDADAANLATVTLAPDDYLRAWTGTHRDTPHTLTVHRSVVADPAALVEALRAASSTVARQRYTRNLHDRVASIANGTDVRTFPLGAALPGAPANALAGAAPLSAPAAAPLTVYRVAADTRLPSTLADALRQVPAAMPAVEAMLKGMPGELQRLRPEVDPLLGDPLLRDLWDAFAAGVDGLATGAFAGRAADVVRGELERVLALHENLVYRLGGTGLTSTADFVAGALAAPREVLVLGEWSGRDATTLEAVKAVARLAGRPVVAVDLGHRTAGVEAARALDRALRGFRWLGETPLVYATASTRASGEEFRRAVDRFTPMTAEWTFADGDPAWRLAGPGLRSTMVTGVAEVAQAVARVPMAPTPTGMPRALAEYLTAPDLAAAEAYLRDHHTELTAPGVAEAMARAAADVPGDLLVGALGVALDVARASGGSAARLRPEATGMLDVEPRFTGTVPTSFVFEFLAADGDRSAHIPTDGLLFQIMTAGALSHAQTLTLVRAAAKNPGDVANGAVFQTVVDMLEMALPDGVSAARIPVHPRFKQLAATILVCVDPIDRATWVGRLDSLTDRLREQGDQVRAAWLHHLNDVLANC